MGLPILQEIWDGLRWGIDFVFNKAPKPLLFFIFCALIAVFSVMISFTIQLFGIHCSSTGDVVKISPFNLGANLDILYNTKNATFNSLSYHPEELVSGGMMNVECVKPLCIVEGVYYLASTSQCANQTTIYPYAVAREPFYRCGICTGSLNYTAIPTQISQTLCFGDVLSIPKSSRNWYQKQNCDAPSSCRPPPGYYYEYDNNTYTFDGTGGGSPINITNKVDSILWDAGAEQMYPKTLPIRDIRSATRFKCDSDRNPIFTFFGIPVFDFRVWLLLGLIFVMFIFLTNLGQQNRIK